MSFAIEVPGDANPLTPADLCRVLQSATAANLIERQNAGQQLQTWEAQEGYFSGLQAVFLDKSLPYEIRFQAIIQLKNGVEKYWRLQHTVKNGIRPDEKSLIRSRLFEGTVNEEDKALALHNALTTAKIVRIDFPQEWPDAVGSIVGIVRDAASGGDQERLHGCLHILLRVTKELATARLRKFQTALQAVTPEVVFLLTRIYADKTPVWIRFLTDGRGDDDEADLALLNTLTCLKILRRLFITGYEAPHHDEAVKEFWGTSQVYFGQFLSFVSHDSIVPAPFQDMVGKQLLQFTKLHLNMAELQPAGFVMLPNSLQLVHAYWDLVANFADVFDKSDGIRLTSGEASTSSKSKMEGPLLECLALKGLLLMRACRRIGYQPMQSFKYRSAEAKVEEEQATQLVKTELFKGDFVIQMVNVIITHLFVFRRADLEAWESDPEEWEQAEQSEGNAFEWEVKPCAERLFLDLLTDHKELLIPPLLAYFQTASNPGSDIATKEAVYTALGLAAAHVSNNFDIDALIATTLVQDAQQQGPLAKVLRRRICILLSNWAPIKLGVQSRPLVYEIFRHFLDPKVEINDPVVRITAARQLKWILEDLEFDPQAFLPHTSATLSELIDLIKDVDVEETRIAVLETVRLLVTRMEEHIGQFGDYIMTVLPQVWDGSGKDDYMTKQSIIAILGALVMSMGPAAQKYHHFMIPLLTEAANSTSDLHFHLVDELLELWNNILVQVQAPASDELVGLIKFLLPMLEYQSATADEAMNALGAYMMLAPQAMVGPELRRPTIEALGKAMVSERRDPQREATRALENMVLIANDLGALEGVEAVVRDMIETGLVNKMMSGVREAYEASQTTGPHRVASRINPVQVMDYLAVLSRVAYAMPEGFFFGVIEPFGPSVADVWEWLSAQWFEKVRYMDEPTRQKLFLLALTRLLELPGPVATPLVLGKLQDYVVMWTDVILELQDGIADGIDSLIVEDPGRRTPDEYDTPKLLRELAFQTKDPVCRVNALAFVREHLQAVVERAGGEARFSEDWAVNVDRDVMDRFRALMAGSGVMG